MNKVQRRRALIAKGLEIINNRGHELDVMRQWRRSSGTSTKRCQTRLFWTSSKHWPLAQRLFEKFSQTTHRVH